MPALAEEQHLAHIVLGLQDILAALLQALVIEAEHPRVEAAIRARETTVQRPLANGTGMSSSPKQCVLVAFRRRTSSSVLALLLQERSYPHGVVFVQKVAR